VHHINPFRKEDARLDTLLSQMEGLKQHNFGKLFENKGGLHFDLKKEMDILTCNRYDIGLPDNDDFEITKFDATVETE